MLIMISVINRYRSTNHTYTYTHDPRKVYNNIYIITLNWYIISIGVMDIQYIYCFEIYNQYLIYNIYIYIYIHMIHTTFIYKYNINININGVYIYIHNHYQYNIYIYLYISTGSCLHLQVLLIYGIKNTCI